MKLLINAEQAREIANQSADKKEINDLLAKVENEIKLAAEGGNYSVKIYDLGTNIKPLNVQLQVIKILSDNGFKVKQFFQKNTYKNMPNTFGIVSWND